MTPRLFVLMLILSFSLAGCTEDDDDDVGPVGPTTERGTIEIFAEPAHLRAPWQLSGPRGYSVSALGDTTIASALAGQYTLTWDELANHVTPEADTKTLAANDTLTFTGVYQVLSCHLWRINDRFDDFTPTDDDGNVIGPEAPENWCPPGNRADSLDLLSSPYIFPAYPNPSAGVIHFRFGIPNETRVHLRIFDDECRMVRVLVDAVLPAGEHTIPWAHVNDLGHRFPDGSYVCEMVVDSFSCLGTIRIESEAPAPPPLNFVYIPPGTFTMGSPSIEFEGRPANESPHTVTLTRGFYMSVHEVTEEWWSEVMNEESTDLQLPKRGVSWDMAVAFCNELSDLENLDRAYEINGPNGNVTWNRDADGYRLPTEAEWEYACRANSNRAFSGAHITNLECNDSALNARGWYCGNYNYDGAKVVGLKQPNAWGLYDMHGNVWEWVWDGLRPYPESLLYPLIDPVHDVGTGTDRVRRGGAFNSVARFCRSAYRSTYAPTQQYQTVGLRPVRWADR